MLDNRQTEAALLLIERSAQLAGVAPDRITIEINQDLYGGDPTGIPTLMQTFRGMGMKICIDDFGAGRSGLRELERHQPDSIALNEKLVRGIDSNGALQAIVRGILQTCTDLGIDVIAKHIRTPAEYHWFRHEGLHLFQGDMIGPALTESLTTEIRLRERQVA